jgi:hypothetical protein
MSFGLPPFGGIGASFQILDVQQHASGLQPTRSIKSDGESRNAGKLGPAARVPAKPLGEDRILNQNPIFEMGSSCSPVFPFSAEGRQKCLSAKSH